MPSSTSGSTSGPASPASLARRGAAAREAAQRRPDPHRRPRQVADAVHAEHHQPDPRPGRRASTNFYVEQSSCCPSRASILSGLYAHNHGVIGNVWPEGGYDRWKETEQGDDLPVWLEAVRLPQRDARQVLQRVPLPPRQPPVRRREGGAAAFVPPGWQSWASPVQGNAYAQDHYRLNVDGDGRRGLPRGLPRLAGSASGRCRPGRRWRRLRLRRGRAVPLLRVVLPHTPYAYPPELEGTFADAQYPRTPGLRRGRRLRQVRADPDAQAADGRRRRDHRRDLPQADPLGAGARPERRRSWCRRSTTRARSTTPTWSSPATTATSWATTGARSASTTSSRAPCRCRSTSAGPGSRPARRTTTWPATSTSPRRSPRSPAPRARGRGRGLAAAAAARAASRSRARYFLLGRALTPTNTTTANGLEEAPETFVEDSRSSELNDFTGVTNGRYKLIRYTHLPHEELYDLSNDPYELDNLLRRRRGVVRRDVAARAASAVDTLRAALDRLDRLRRARPAAERGVERSGVTARPRRLERAVDVRERLVDAGRRRLLAPAVRRAGRCRSRAAPAARSTSA